MALTNPKSVINVEKLSYFKGKLAQSDSAVAGQVVKAVSETGGIISVSRAALNATDIQLVAVEQSTSSQYAAQYKLVVGKTETAEGTALGATINIPKDQFLKDAKLYASKAAADAAGKTDYPTTWTADNFPAIRFEFQLSGSTNPLWVSVKDLVDTYTGGDGISIDNNEISVNLADHSLQFSSDGKLRANLRTNGALNTGDYGMFVKTDGVSIAIPETGTYSDTLQVKVSGNGGLKIDTSVSPGLAVKAPTNGGLITNVNGLSVNTDDATIEKNTSGKLQIKSGGVTNAKVASDAALSDGQLATASSTVKGAVKVGSGLEMTGTSSDVLGAKVDSSNANGLSVGASGIAMAVATTSAAGAMSSADKTKLNGIEIGANKGIKTINAGNGIDVTEGTDATEVTVNVYLAEDSGLEFTGTNDEALTCKFAENSDIDSMFS